MISQADPVTHLRYLVVLLDEHLSNKMVLPTKINYVFTFGMVSDAAEVCCFINFDFMMKYSAKFFFAADFRTACCSKPFYIYRLVACFTPFNYLCPMEIINPLAEAYASQFTSTEDALLQEVAAATQGSHAHAHMLADMFRANSWNDQ